MLNVPAENVPTAAQLDQIFSSGWVVFASTGKAIRYYNPNPERVTIESEANPPELTRDEAIIFVPQISWFSQRGVYRDNIVQLPRKPDSWIAFGTPNPVSVGILASTEQGIVWAIGVR